MKTNWLILMLLASVTANAQVYIGSNPNGRPSPGVALEVESSNMGIQFPVIELDVDQSLETKFSDVSVALPEGTMVYVKLKNDYNNSTVNYSSKYKTNGDGFYVKTSGVTYNSNERHFLDANSMSWEFSGVVEEKFVNNQVVNGFLGYSIVPYSLFETSTDTYNVLTASENGYDFQFCKKNVETNHTYCVFKDTTSNNSNNTWLSAYNLAKSKRGYLLTITNQKEYQYVFENIFSYSGQVYNSSNTSTTLDLSSQNYKTWMGFTTYVVDEFKNGINKTDSTPTYYDGITTSHIGNLKYFFITGEEFLMDWENSSQTGATVETASYYDRDTFKLEGRNLPKFKSAYYEYNSNSDFSSLKKIKAEEIDNTSRTGDFKYVIVEYTN